MREILNKLATDHALAQWRAAEAILKMVDWDVAKANELITSHVGRGLANPEGELLITMVQTISDEKEAYIQFGGK